MLRIRLVVIAAAALVLGVALGSVGCSKKKSTSPTSSSTALASAALSHGQTYAKALAVAGTYAYHCSIHGGMHGTVVVSAASVDMAKAVSIEGFAFVPASVTIAPGGTVTWTQNDADPTKHTVTSD